MNSIQIDGSSLDLDAVSAVAWHGAPVEVPADARQRMERSRAWVERAARVLPRIYRKRQV